ncbi:MBL fold metallo-hydrolase [Psychrobacter sp. B38]|uniref:MBL fold metallo-hydrolase n=1 Tax=Psychrobacter sp. B38 TaxID=3143538 RepID=UPI00320DFD7B
MSHIIFKTTLSTVIVASLLSACSAIEPKATNTNLVTTSDNLYKPDTHPAGLPTSPNEMRVTLLGTGSPVPSVSRYSMSTLVQANGYNFVFDAGRGNVIRLTQAGVPLGKIDGVFLTHYHSDHVNGLSDLWMTGYIPAFGGRAGGLEVYGPKGVNALVEGLKMAHADDIRVRVADKEIKDESTTDIRANEFDTNSVVFNKNGVKITSFDVEHDHNGAIQPAVGFRIDYAGHSVLLSGDTTPTPNVIKYGKDVDLLIHEVADFEDINALPQVYAHHTNPRQASNIFNQTRPKMAVYSHIVDGGSSKKLTPISDDEFIKRTRENYSGPLVMGKDLMSFSITSKGVEVYRY